ncbi:MAG TPA: Fis family transcriptional regulator [Cyanobacteria bacterium UBA8553]|nr:Fis family transcriptional regulator [Cyanobacteria bacterium UBA8553]HAJ63287.1 Fis family transcriptional regulator [Cyanobacteria bacterium UBA8543]
MTFNFDARKPSRQEAAREMDSLQRDRFELLSAFIDGEVTAAERKQVQALLETDPQIQVLYSRLLKLRQGLQKMPVPAAEVTAQETVQEVFTRIDRRRIHRIMIGGGAAIAAVFITALSGVFSGTQQIPQLAQSPKQEVAPEPLQIALKQPLIDLPKEAVAAPEKLKQLPAVPYQGHKKHFN